METEVSIQDLSLDNSHENVAASGALLSSTTGQISILETPCENAENRLRHNNLIFLWPPRNLGKLWTAGHAFKEALS